MMKSKELKTKIYSHARSLILTHMADDGHLRQVPADFAVTGCFVRHPETAALLTTAVFGGMVEIV